MSEVFRNAYMIVLFALSFAAPADWADQCAAADEPAHPLAEFGFEPNIEGVRQCLEMFLPSEERLREIRARIGELDDESFAVRDRATDVLTNYPVVPIRLLQEASQSESSERAWRAKSILENRSNDRSEKMLAAALQTIERRELRSLAGVVVDVLEQGGTEPVRGDAAGALAATTSAKDAELLLRAAKSETAVVRYAAVKALSVHLGKEAAAELQRLADDKDPHVKLAAALALGDVGDRASLRPLVELLEANDLSIRLKSAQALRHLAQKKFGYNAVATAEQRAKAAAAWDAWVREEGQTAALRFPIELPKDFDLLAGPGLAGWKVILGGHAVDHDAGGRQIALEGGTLKIAEGVNGYVRTERAFTAYRLTAEWRWPEEHLNDAGILLLLTGEDDHESNALEVQLHQGNAGDFYRIGRFRGGEFSTGVRSRLADSSDKPRGEWNRMEVELLGGDLSVKINGVLQNKAANCPVEPSRIGLRLEGDPIEFRNIRVQPL